VCTPKAARPACAGPLKIGVGYLYILCTHCGIFDTYFAGRLWRAHPRRATGKLSSATRGSSAPYMFDPFR
jgi:hypothetical protein